MHELLACFSETLKNMGPLNLHSYGYAAFRQHCQMKRVERVVPMSEEALTSTLPRDRRANYSLVPKIEPFDSVQL